jgi:hypothetical protein
MGSEAVAPVKKARVKKGGVPPKLPILDVLPSGDVVEAAQEVIQKVAVDKDWIRDRLAQIVERCMQAEPVLDREGKPTGEFTFQAPAAIRALELLGKDQGMFVDRKEVLHGNIETLSDERLRELIAKHAAAAGVGLVAIGSGAPGAGEPTSSV